MRVFYKAEKNPTIAGKKITTDRTGLAIDNRPAWSVPNENPDWLFPWTSWTCVIEDDFILQAYGYEHTKGGDVGHALVVLDAGGKEVRTLPGHFCEGAVYTSPDKNRRLAWLHLLEYWQGVMGYNTLINAGQPPLVLNSYSLPGFGRTNQWLVEVPERLKAHYNAKGLSYKSARLETEGNDIWIVSDPPARGEVDLKFRVAFPWL